MLATPSPQAAPQSAATAVVVDPLVALLRTAPSVQISLASSCSQEAAFDWSDFPLIYDAPSSSHAVVSRHSSSSSFVVVDDDEEEQLMSYSSSCSSSTDDSDNDDFVEVRTSSTPTRTLSNSPQQRLQPRLRAETVADPAPSSSPAVVEAPPKKPKRKNSCCSCGSNNKGVSFSNVVEVRSHRIILSDHPSCVGGMALECDWDCERVEHVDLDAYEKSSNKRRPAELRLTYAERRKRLQRSMGLSGPELLQKEFELFCGGGDDCDDNNNNLCDGNAKPSVLRHTPSVRRALLAATNSDLYY